MAEQKEGGGAEDESDSVTLEDDLTAEKSKTVVSLVDAN